MKLMLSLALTCLPAMAWQPGQFIPHKLVSHHHGQGAGTSEWMPDYAAIASITATNGRWSAMARMPGQHDVVLIPSGVEVIYDVHDNVGFKAVVVQGRLIFEPTLNTRMTVGTIMVENIGVLRIAPSSRSVSATVIFSGALNTVEDPMQFSNGLVSNGGRIEVIGTPVVSPIAKTQATSGQSNVVVAGPMLGDLLVFPDQQLGANPGYWNFQYKPQTERRTVAATQGNLVTLSSPLSFNHGNTWVGNLTRNVAFSSAQGSPRAHILFGGHARVEFRNAAIIDMGRTTTAERDDTRMSTNGTPIRVGKNQRARYALHAHHVHEPVVLHGNAIYNQNTAFGSERFGIVLHDSRGDVRSNIVMGARGSGIFLEDGVETGEVSDNLVIGTGGGSGLGDDIRFSALQGEDMGSGGFGIWARGTLVKIRNNIAVGHFSQAAYAYFTHGNFVSGIVPDIPGNPTNLIGRRINIGQMPIQAYGAFDGNVAIGIFEHAMQISYQQTSGTILTNVTLRMLNNDGTGLHVVHCNETVLNNCAITSVGGSSIGAWNNSGSGGKLTLNGGSLSGLHVGVPTFPAGGVVNVVSFQSNRWNVAIINGSGLTDVRSYVGRNYRVHNTAQPGSVNVAGIYGHCLPIP